MTFEHLKTEVNNLRHLLKNCLNSDYLQNVTVEEPQPPEDELHFIRLVNWGYVFFNEAGQPIFRELNRLLKSSDPLAAQFFNNAKEDLDALRTNEAHNLPHEKANIRKIARVQAWFDSIGLEPKDWAICCARLAAQQISMVQALTETVRKATETEEDKTAFCAGMIGNISNNWQVYEFDALTEVAAFELKLTGFDVVSFRKSRQERWQTLAKLFLTRSDAKSALERAIHAELMSLFGEPQKE